MTPADSLRDLLRQQADEIARAGHAGWGNTMIQAADALGELRGALMELRIRLHAAGRRPEECYEMSLIDEALRIAT